MKITKFGHACLLVEMPAPVNRTALFDPGMMSKLDVDSLVHLDDIFITHGHSDHLHMDYMKQLVAKFPNVRILAPQEVVDQLSQAGINSATVIPPEGVTLFDSPHEDVEPMFPAPQEIGIHYLDKLTHPGDSHSFSETKAILALPVDAPWGSTLAALKLALKLKPKYVIPIHDWFWHDDARSFAYERLDTKLTEQGVTFIKPVDGEPFVLDV